MKKKTNKFTKEALFKSRDIKHSYSETFVKSMDPCAKPENQTKDR